MKYTERLREKEAELEDIKSKFELRTEIMKHLSIGDVVYEEGTHGGWDTEYYPQSILEFNFDEGEILVHEKSTDKTKWISSFHIEDANGKIQHIG